MDVNNGKVQTMGQTGDRQEDESYHCSKVDPFLKFHCSIQAQKSVFRP